MRPDASAFTSSESTHIVVRVAPLARLVSDRPLAAEVRTCLCVIYGGKSNNRREIFFGVLRFYPVSIIPSFLHTRHRLFHFQEGRKDEAWKPSKKRRYFGRRRASSRSILLRIVARLQNHCAFMFAMYVSLQNG